MAARKLALYRAKRDFRVTGEPSGQVKVAAANYRAGFLLPEDVRDLQTK